jgi:hypothetical protein
MSNIAEVDSIACSRRGDESLIENPSSFVIRHSSLYFGIPPSDREEFGQLPDGVGDKVRLRLTWMRTIHLSRKRATACKALAATCDLSYDRLRTLYYAFARTGDWRVLKDSRRSPVPSTLDSRLSTQFLDFVKRLYERNQRKFAPAHVELLTIWRTRHTSRGEPVKAIPGYREWPQAEPDTDMPAGWHYSNLLKKIKDHYAAAATKLGRTAAADFRPQVPVTRVHLKLGQRYIIDDQWYDLKVNFLGISKQSLRPLGLDAIDHLSGCFVAHGFRPRLWDEAAGVNRTIKVAETQWLIAHMLCNVGYREDTGTIIACEHGTANVTAEFEERVSMVTGHKVSFNRSGIGGDPAFAGQFEGQSKGNFRYKAALESLFNLVRNRQAALPGATGKDRQHCPEQLHGMDRYNQRLLQAYEALPPDRKVLLQFPFLNWHQFIQMALYFYTAIDHRTDHNLEGWKRLGFLGHEWRPTPDSPWRPASEIAMFSVEQRNAIHALVQEQPHLYRIRQLSPREVWDSRKHELTKLPDALVPMLLGPGEAREITVTKEGYFVLEDQDLSAEPLRYLAETNGQLLPRGETYLGYLNWFSPDRLIVCRARARKSDSSLDIRHSSFENGGYLGSCRPWDRENVLDTAAIARRCGEVAKIEAELIAPIARRGAELIRQKTAMHKNNAAVLAGKPVTAEEKARARILKGAITSAPDALDALPNPENLEEVQSLSPGLRGTSYPGDDAPPNDPTLKGLESSGYSITADELNALPST